MNNNPNTSSNRHEDYRSKRTKAELGATALEMRQFLAQGEEQIKREVEEAEKYHDLVDRKYNHIIDPSIPEHFVDWQIECFETIRHEKNVILSAPTGSGKTQVFMEWAKEKQKEAEKEGLKNTTYITAPIKALSNQRFRELKEQGYKVGLETGDIKNVPEDVDYICCTQEIFTNKYCDDENATLIVDEFHYIFENQDRSRAYIDGIHNTKAKNTLLCSATFGDMEKLTNYVNKASSRDFTPYESHERLTELDYNGYIPYDEIKDSLVVTFSANNCERVANDLADCWNDCDDEQKEKIEKICKEYKVNFDPRLAKGIATYYGKKLPKEKLCIEKLFEERLIDTVVGTDALALGVNFPVKNVVFAQLAKYNDGPISKNLFEQLAGRAGRKGYFDKGFVYYCDDFRDYRGYSIENRYYDTADLFEDLLTAEPESVNISLNPNIKGILNGEKSIDEEASYISEYSTDNKSFEESKQDVEEIISLIRDFKVGDCIPMSWDDGLKLERLRMEECSPHYEDDKVRIHDATYRSGSFTFVEDREGVFPDIDGNSRYVFDYDDNSEKYILSGWPPREDMPEAKKNRIEELVAYGYQKIEERTQQIEAEIEALYEKKRESYSELQAEFNENIGKTYTDLLSPEQNCRLLAGILLGETDDSVWSFAHENDDYYYDGYDMQSLLLKRQVIMSLPKKYRKNFNIAKIDKEINQLDETVLNQGRGLVKTDEIKDGINKESANKESEVA